MPTAANVALIAAFAFGCADKSPPPAPAAPVAAPPPPDATAVAPPADAAPAPSGPRWLKGNTHTHTDASADSQTAAADVVRWYTDAGYDFVVFTDHNLVRAYAHDGPLLVLPGVELTHNPSVCDPPPPEPRGHCRIHVNALFTAEVPTEKLEWTPDARIVKRVDKYQLAFDLANQLGGLIQVNHPNWHWGIDGPMLADLASRGALLVEIANQAFVTWNVGRDGKYPSMTEIWDAALTAGATVWGVASDDAHNYYDVTYQREKRMGFGYPPGGGFVMVYAEKDPAAIRVAMAAGRFYSSTGVTLANLAVDAGVYRVEVADGGFPPHQIRFVGTGGAELAVHTGSAADLALADAPPGYVRAEIRDRYGRRAWTQPVRVPLAPAASPARGQ